MTPDMALMRLQSFANGLEREGFERQAEWVRGFRSDLVQLLTDEEVINVA